MASKFHFLWSILFWLVEECTLAYHDQKYKTDFEAYLVWKESRKGTKFSAWSTANYLTFFITHYSFKYMNVSMFVISRLKTPYFTLISMMLSNTTKAFRPQRSQGQWAMKCGCRLSIIHLVVVKTSKHVDIFTQRCNLQAGLTRNQIPQKYRT